MAIEHENEVDDNYMKKFVGSWQDENVEIYIDLNLDLNLDQFDIAIYQNDRMLPDPMHVSYDSITKYLYVKWKTSDCHIWHSNFKIYNENTLQENYHSKRSKLGKTTSYSCLYTKQ